jgi:hypothetical protein
MIVHPLQRGVAEYTIVSLVVFIGPSSYVAHEPSQMRVCLTGGGDHLWRAVQPCQLSLGPAFSQNGSTVPRPAAQVNYTVGNRDGDASRQFPAGPRALVIEAKILFGIPCGHDNELYLIIF